MLSGNGILTGLICPWSLPVNLGMGESRSSSFRDSRQFPHYGAHSTLATLQEHVSRCGSARAFPAHASMISSPAGIGATTPSLSLMSQFLLGQQGRIWTLRSGRIFRRSSTRSMDVCQLKMSWLLTCKRWKVKRERLRRSMSDGHHGRSQLLIAEPSKERWAGLPQVDPQALSTSREAAEV
jgi:hypothetical protein